ncbi:hypothetical protein B0I37DRAFT_148940 [Chaetomium sp. MPI-CAGE-AT-0009]|nr:hypothetical protein B0I37DRAFT_148940 [Chaetomium sp. MPI-CAGE-AT-0009]
MFFLFSKLAYLVVMPSSQPTPLYLLSNLHHDDNSSFVASTIGQRTHRRVGTYLVRCLKTAGALRLGAGDLGTTLLARNDFGRHFDVGFWGCR